MVVLSNSVSFFGAELGQINFTIPNATCFGDLRIRS